MLTSTELEKWQNQNFNHTNFQEIQMEHFRMCIFMNAFFSWNYVVGDLVVSSNYGEPRNGENLGLLDVTLYTWPL
jgi:hypothetical protein